MRRRDFLLATVIIVAAAGWVYRAAASAYFFDDDFQWLVGTWAFHPRQLVDIAHLSHFYRPVIDLYFAVATPLAGGSPTIFHLANIGLHAVNGVLVLMLAREASGNTAYAFLTALFFIVQPADVDAVAWVSALAEAVGACFGCVALIGFLRFRRGGKPAWRLLSIAAFLLALLTHESSVIVLPLLALADWAFTGVRAPADGRTPPWTSRVRTLAPYALLTTAYLAVDLPINSRNYLITEGHYTIGGHAVTNAARYIIALYVGRADAANYALVAGGLILVLLRGSRRVVFAAGWLMLALMPFVFFRWSNASRYLYLPAIGFSMLAAEGVLLLDRLPLSRPARTAAVAIAAMAIAGRFALFAAGNVRDFADRTEEYRRYITRFKQAHGEVPSHSRVRLDPPPEIEHPHQFLNALVQWEYRDPTIELIPDWSPPH